MAPSSQLPCDVLVKLFVREVFLAVDGLLVESPCCVAWDAVPKPMVEYIDPDF